MTRPDVFDVGGVVASVLQLLKLPDDGEKRAGRGPAAPAESLREEPGSRADWAGLSGRAERPRAPESRRDDALGGAVRRVRQAQQEAVAGRGDRGDRRRKLATRSPHAWRQSGDKRAMLTEGRSAQAADHYSFMEGELSCSRSTQDPRTGQAPDGRPSAVLSQRAAQGDSVGLGGEAKPTRSRAAGEGRQAQALKGSGPRRRRVEEAQDDAADERRSDVMQLSRCAARPAVGQESRSEGHPVPRRSSMGSLCAGEGQGPDHQSTSRWAPAS